MAVCAHVVIPVKQLASVDFIVEVVGEATHHSFNVVVFLEGVPGEVFFAIPFTAVGFLEVVERVFKLHIVIDCIVAVLVAQFRIFSICPFA